MSVNETIIDAETADGPMAVVRKKPDAGTDKRVMIFMDAPGIRASLHEYAVRLAGEGYEVAIPDLWHRHGRLIGYEPADIAADPLRRAHIGEMLGTLTDAGTDMDREAALAALGWDTGSLGAIGFCMGARGVHRAMIAHPDRFVAGAMWHPSFLTDDTDASPHLTVDDLAGQLYIGIGTADRVQSIEMHQRYLDAAALRDNIEVNVIDGADHGFTWPISPNYHEQGAEESWSATLDLFGRRL
ncbi:MAG: dienelactone hydrolase family protein [Acidimicrobiales bacterium]|nr:dienelactone hydrolase family protein [Acidimicrobiales bacterium]